MKSSDVSSTRLVTILVPWRLFGESVYQRVEQLAELDNGAELVVIGCGDGRGVIWLMQHTGSRVEGVDADSPTVEHAQVRARRAGLNPLPTFQSARAVDLPYESEVFDGAVVDLLALGRDAEADALKETARVLRPLARVFCIAPVWTADPIPSDRATITEHLQFRPRYIVEWKQLLRDAGIVDLSVEAIGKDGAWMERRRVLVALGGWREAGWPGLRFAFSKPYDVLRSAASSRTIGLSLIWGAKWPSD